MNESDASGLLGVGMHEMDWGQESYATECLKMNQGTSAMYTDHSNASAFLEEYNMSGIQPLEELRFGNTQHLELQSQRMVADSEDKSVPSSPDTSSTTNCDMPGYMEQNLQHIYNAYDTQVDKDGPVMLSPDFIMCDEILHLEPHLTFSSDGIKIECLDLDLDKMITFDWGLSNIISISCKWAQSVGSALITFIAESEAENGNSGPVRVQFSLDDLQWPRKQQKIWHLEKRYQDIWKDIPSDDFASENWSIEPNFEDVIYPKGDPDAVSISKRDAELLLPETFVNDTIIDFYIKHLTTRIDSTEKHKSHFFNSFFFRKLADLDKDQGRAPEGRAAFLRVHKWTRKINIFEKDFVFIPVNFSLHWSLIVVCYPGEAAILGAKQSAKLPCILHMDSLKGSHSGLKDIIQSYLWEEWKEKHPESAADNSDKFLNLRFVSLELPQQDNSFDCGLFLLHYVELFLMDVPSNFNPLKIDVFSSFLSDDWFPPAEASHKRSVIQKLIHEVVTGSFQNHPKLVCSNEQLDERHQSRNAEGEPAGDFPSQSCSADQAELVCTIRDDAHGAQESTSICLNDSEEKVLSASGGMVNTGMVSMVAGENLQEPGVCLPENDTVVCLSSQDEKTETLVDMRSCGPEDGKGLEGSSCGVSYMEHAESLLLALDDNQKYSSEVEVKVQDIMVSSCHSISHNSEVLTYEEYSLQRNTDGVGHECYRPSQDMDSLVMLDSSKDDIRPNPEKMTAEDGGNDLGINMGSATQDDINTDVAEVKHEDSLVDHVIIENAIKHSVKEIDSIADNIDHSEQYVSSELTEEHADNGMADHISQLNVGNSDRIVACDNAVSSGLNEGNTNQTITGGVVTYETNINADGVDAYKHSATSGPISCGDAVAGAVPCGDTTCAMAEAVPPEDTICTEAQDGAVPREDTICTEAQDGAVPRKDTTYAMAEAVPCEDTTCTEAQDGTVPCEDTKCAMPEAVPCEDTTCTEARDGTVSREDMICTMVEAVPCEDTTCTKAQDGTVPREDLTCAMEAVPCEDATCTEAQDGKVPHEGDTSCTDSEMQLEDRSCCIKDETNPDNTASDAKRPLLDGISEEKDIAICDDKCIQKDDWQGTVAKSPLPDSICDEDIVLSDDKCIQKDVQVTDTERPLSDSLCEEKVVSGDRCTGKGGDHVHDSKRPLPEGLCEKYTSVPERCVKKDNLHGTDAKIERHYKRRKVLAAESMKERSSSGA